VGAGARQNLERKSEVGSISELGPHSLLKKAVGRRSGFKKRETETARTGSKASPNTETSRPTKGGKARYFVTRFLVLKGKSIVTVTKRRRRAGKRSSIPQKVKGGKNRRHIGMKAVQAKLTPGTISSGREGKK